MTLEAYRGGMEQRACVLADQLHGDDADHGDQRQEQSVLHQGDAAVVGQDLQRTQEPLHRTYIGASGPEFKWDAAGAACLGLRRRLRRAGLFPSSQ
jgi:hypothetical protein